MSTQFDTKHYKYKPCKTSFKIIQLYHNYIVSYIYLVGASASVFRIASYHTLGFQVCQLGGPNGALSPTLTCAARTLLLLLSPSFFFYLPSRPIRRTIFVLLSSKLLHLHQRHTSPMDRAEALARLEPSLVDQFLGAVGRDPDAVRDALVALAADPATVEPVMDYVTEVDERCRLFQELAHVCRDGSSSQLNATVLAFVMVAPVSEIRSGISAIKGGHNPSMTLLGYNSIAPFAVRSCTSPHLRPPTPFNLLR